MNVIFSFEDFEQFLSRRQLAIEVRAIHFGVVSYIQAVNSFISTCNLDIAATDLAFSPSSFHSTQIRFFDSKDHHYS
jgi:hypothetical protein